MITGRSPHHGPRKRRQSERGAVAVEFAGLVPLLGLCALIIWQLILIGLTSMFASHAATEGARQAAVTPADGSEIRDEAKKRVSPPWNSKEAFSVKTIERDCDINGNNCKLYVQATIKTPAVLPGMHTPWQIGSEQRVITEDSVA